MPLSRTEKAAVITSAFAIGLMATLLILDHYGFFS